MKFSHSFAALFVLLPALVQGSPLGSFQNGINNQAANKGANANKGASANKGGNNAGKGGAAAASSSVAAATTAAAASASSAAASSGSGGDAQTSLTLLQSVIATGFESDGQATPTAGQVASLTSSNNFINFCATVANLPITNGQQITSGSCNPAPMGVIASTANMPSAKFVFPANGQTIAANQNFTIQMAISHLNTGNFVNPDTNFFAAPQTVDSSGDITGHSHVVIETLTALDQTTVTDPTKFAFFKGLNDPAQNGVLSVAVAGGLPAGTYRLASINSAANHQPVLVAIAQHGSLDDMVYFTVSDSGAAASGSGAAGASATVASASTAAAAAPSSAAAASASATVGAIKGNNTGKTAGAQGGFAGGNAAKGAQKGGNNAATGAATGAQKPATGFGKGGFKNRRAF